MRSRIWKIWPALALGFVMAAPGVANAADAANKAHASVVQGAGGGIQPAAGAAARPEAGARPVAAPPRRIAGLASPGGGWTRRSLSEIGTMPGTAPPAGRAKNHALLLSSLGMLGVIALHRLGRTF